MTFSYFLDLRKFNTYGTLSVDRDFESHVLPVTNNQEPYPCTGYDVRPTRPYSRGTVEHRKTKLYDFHVQSNGKMVPFGGYLLPVIIKFLFYTGNCLFLNTNSVKCLHLRVELASRK
jgi:hypothetical protein